MRNLIVIIVLISIPTLMIYPKETYAAYRNHNCNIVQVQYVVTSTITNGSRVAAKCQAAAPNGIVWFAYNVDTNTDKSKMVLSLLTAAKVSGRTVNIGYESTDTSGDSWGCQAANCRTIMQINLL